jgi:hypothetical protein
MKGGLLTPVYHQQRAIGCELKQKKKKLMAVFSVG